MPGTTPVFGIRYPTLGDPIDPTVFANFANDVEGVLAGTALRLAQKTNAPSALLYAAPGQTYTAAIEKTPNYLVWADTDAMWSAGTPGQITIVTPGVYLLSTWGWELGNPAGWTSLRVTLVKNGNIYAGAKKHVTTSSTPAYTSLNTLMPLAAGDIALVRFLVTGGVAVEPINAGFFAASLVCRF